MPGQVVGPEPIYHRGPAGIKDALAPIERKYRTILATEGRESLTANEMSELIEEVKIIYTNNIFSPLNAWPVIRECLIKNLGNRQGIVVPQ